MKKKHRYKIKPERSMNVSKEVRSYENSKIEKKSFDFVVDILFIL